MDVDVEPKKSKNFSKNETFEQIFKDANNTPCHIKSYLKKTTKN